MQGPQQASHRQANSVHLAFAPSAKAQPNESPTAPASTFTASPRPSFVPGTSTANLIDEAGDFDGKKRRDTGEPMWRRVKANVVRHAAFAGPGIVAAVAYIDPGNWATDLQAGSQFGYSHLFIVLLSGLMALLFQILSARLGCVSDQDLATHCRLALSGKRWHRWALLYPLYLLSEGGIVMTDLAELLGSAIAINLIVPKIPLYGAVLLTSTDVFLILILFSQYPTKFVTRSMRAFEFFIGLLVIIVLGSFVALLVKVSPNWRDVFHGYVPGPKVVSNGALYVAVGIIGATVMPHAFFIGSKMATMRRLAPEEYEDDDSIIELKTTPPNHLESSQSSRPTHARSRSMTASGPMLHLPQPFSLAGYDLATMSPRMAQQQEINVDGDGQPSQTQPKKVIDDQPDSLQKPTLACVRAHLTHSVWDIAGSLLGFALVINSAILILAAAVFYYGDGHASRPDGVSDLFDAFDLVKEFIGTGFAYLFAVGLLASGQAASLTVTLSGQIIGEGFIKWKTVPWKRRLITRCIGIIPSLAVSLSIGRGGIDDLLVGSQVALSIVLTFVTVPLIVFTSQHSVMAVPISPTSCPPSPLHAQPSRPWTARRVLTAVNPFRKRNAPLGTVSYANPVWIIWLCVALWILIGAANLVALIDLGAGES